MNIETRIKGERIAKAVVAQTQAFEVLRQRSRVSAQWYVLLFVFCFSFGFFNATYTGAHAQLVLSAVSSVAIYVSIFAFLDCLSLRKRLDAAIVLLLKNED